MVPEVRSDLRLAELTVALSLATDLGTGQPLEHALRTCWLSLAASDALGGDSRDRSTLYYVALLRFLGCTSDASDTARLAGGDDVRFNTVMAPMLMASSAQGMRYFMRHLGEDLPAPRRLARVAAAMTDLGGAARSLSGHCEVASRLAGRLGLPAAVSASLAHAYERWDGRGAPDGLAGDAVPLPIRIVTVARDVELWARQHGWEATREMLAGRRGRAYDASVVDVFAAQGEAWVATIESLDVCAAVLAGEPAPHLTVDEAGLDAALAAVADFVDLKSPFLRGHSPAVAALAASAALAVGLGEDEAVALGRAGLVHDVGRVGVASGIWDRRGPLSAEQWERVRLHPYLAERVLGRCAALAPYAALAGAHHERADGSGYHRGAAEAQLPMPARLLAAADAYEAMTEERPHRPALSAPEAALQLQDDADAGRFGRPEVEAVLDAAGQLSRPARVSRPADLTEREVDVLRLIARGLTNKAVAAKLGISTKTVGHHVEHIYAKAAVRTRAGATLFAMEHGILQR